MKREGKLRSLIVISMLIGVFLMSLSSAGVIEWIKTITGKATSQQFELNITVGGPSVYAVYNQTDAAVDVQENTFTEVIINFSVSTPLGAVYLNHSTATVNLSFTGQDVRENSSCYPYEISGNYANYTCNITMWWWDINETWVVTAYIKDNSSSSGINNTVTQEVGETSAFIGGPSPLTWSAISPGDSNQTSNNDPYIMNNTGNIVIPSNILKMNSTHLRGEENSAEAIWAGNFSINWSTGGSPPAECGGTPMNHGEFTAVTGANLSTGNYTLNDGATGQERLYFCIREVDSSLSTQAYSTADEGLWTVDIGGVV
jgi:hypothetical protein